MRIPLFAALVAVALVAASNAGAVEREHHLGVDLGAAMLVVSDKSAADVGPALGVHWSYGLSDAFNLMVDGAWSAVDIGEKAQGPTTPKTRPMNVTNVDVGVAYVFDVLQWVPWAGVLVGGYALAGGTLPSAKLLPGAAIALGLDYRWSRTLLFGVSVRQHAFTESSTYPSFTQAFARIEYSWGW